MSAIVRANAKDNETLACQFATNGTSGHCVFTVEDETETLWIEVLETMGRPAENVTFKCHPNLDVDQFLAAGRDSAPFMVSERPATFAMQIPAGKDM